MQVDNRSLTTAEGREAAWKLVRELAALLDTAYMDRPHQLFSLNCELVTAPGQQGELAARTAELNGKFTEQEDDF